MIGLPPTLDNGLNPIPHTDEVKRLPDILDQLHAHQLFPKKATEDLLVLKYCCEAGVGSLVDYWAIFLLPFFVC